MGKKKLVGRHCCGAPRIKRHALAFAVIQSRSAGGQGGSARTLSSRHPTRVTFTSIGDRRRHTGDPSTIAQYADGHVDHRRQHHASTTSATRTRTTSTSMLVAPTGVRSIVLMSDTCGSRRRRGHRTSRLRRRGRSAPLANAAAAVRQRHATSRATTSEPAATRSSPTATHRHCHPGRLRRRRTPTAPGRLHVRRRRGRRTPVTSRAASSSPS